MAMKNNWHVHIYEVNCHQSWSHSSVLFQSKKQGIICMLQVTLGSLNFCSCLYHTHDLEVHFKPIVLICLTAVLWLNVDPPFCRGIVEWRLCLPKACLWRRTSTTSSDVRSFDQGDICQTSLLKKKVFRPVMGIYKGNHTTWEVEDEGSEIQDQPWLQ